MKIAMINGSPRIKNSNSGIVINYFQSLFGSEHEILSLSAYKKGLTPEQYIELCGFDAIVLVFPLYVDAVPSHLLRMMEMLEYYLKKEGHGDIYVYAIINCGFFEGKQTRNAMRVVKNWCVKSKITFGQAIGQGGGEMLGMLESIPQGHGPLKGFTDALNTLKDNLEAKRKGKCIVLNPAIPRFVWKLGASSFWYKMMKENGLQKKDIRRRVM